MNAGQPKALLAAALVGGYVLGRTKKGRLALSAATYLAGRRFGLEPRRLVADGLQKLAEVPQVAELNEQLRGELMDAGRHAVSTAANRRLTALADSVHDRTLQLNSGVQEPEDEEEEEPEEEFEEEESEEEPERRSRRRESRRTAKSAQGTRTSKKSNSGGAAAKKATPAKKSAAKKKSAPAKKRATGKAAAGSPPAKKTAARKKAASSSKRTADRKTSSRSDRRR